MTEATELRTLCQTLSQALAACGPDDLLGDEPTARSRELHYALCSAALSAALLEGDGNTYERAAALYREKVLDILRRWQPTLELYELAGQPSWARLYRGLNLLGHDDHVRWVVTLNKLRPAERVSERSTELGAQEFVSALWSSAPDLKAALLHSVVRSVRTHAHNATGGATGGGTGILKDLIGHPHLVNWTLAEQTQLLRATTTHDHAGDPHDKLRRKNLIQQLRLERTQRQSGPEWEALTPDDQLLWIELWTRKVQP